jgi:hypothetical protein
MMQEGAEGAPRGWAGGKTWRKEVQDGLVEAVFGPGEERSRDEVLVRYELWATFILSLALFLDFFACVGNATVGNLFLLMDSAALLVLCMCIAQVDVLKHVNPLPPGDAHAAFWLFALMVARLVYLCVHPSPLTFTEDSENTGLSIERGHVPKGSTCSEVSVRATCELNRRLESMMRDEVHTSVRRVECGGRTQHRFPTTIIHLGMQNRAVVMDMTNLTLSTTNSIALWRAYRRLNDTAVTEKAMLFPSSTTRSYGAAYGSSGYSEVPEPLVSDNSHNSTFSS